MILFLRMIVLNYCNVLLLAAMDCCEVYAYSDVLLLAAKACCETRRVEKLCVVQ